MDAKISGPIQKKTSISDDDSSSDSMELDETALVMDPHLDSNLRRLEEEERLLLEQQATMEAGKVDDISALELQDALRLNQLQQHELHRQQQVQVQRIARYQNQLALEQGQSQVLVPAPAHSHSPAHAHASAAHVRRRAVCTVRVNNLHAAEAIETDV